MKTIKYQGKKVRVKLLAELDGYESMQLGREVTGHDQLYRTEAGVYYLEREEWTRGFNEPADGSKEQKREARYYHSVRRISLTAATQWLALTFVDGSEMQYDIAQAMMDGKGYWLKSGETQEEAGSPTSSKAQKDDGESLIDGTLYYQGRAVKATLVNYLHGALPNRSVVDYDGEEDLFRDSEGHYYLRRKLGWFDAGTCEREASGRTYVHRISATAAILWATTRLNSETLHLRRKAAELLTVRNEGLVSTGDAATMLHDETIQKVLRFARATNSDVRDVIEAAVYHCMVVRTEDDDGTGDVRLSEAWTSFTADVQDERDRRRADEAERLTPIGVRASTMKWNSSEDLADGSMVICLHLRPEPARLMRAACLLDEGRSEPINFLYDSLQSVAVATIPGHYTDEAENEAIFEANAPGVDEEPQWNVTLDPEASTMVERYLSDANPRGYTAQQIVNGCVVENLNAAFSDLPNVIELGELGAEEFSDNGWGYHRQVIREHALVAPGPEHERHGLTVCPVREVQPNRIAYLIGFNSSAGFGGVKRCGDAIHRCRFFLRGVDGLLDLAGLFFKCIDDARVSGGGSWRRRGERIVTSLSYRGPALIRQDALCGLRPDLELAHQTAPRRRPVCGAFICEPLARRCHFIAVAGLTEGRGRCGIRFAATQEVAALDHLL